MLSLSQYIDHTILKQTTTDADVEQLVKEAKHFSFMAVCVPPIFVSKAKNFLGRSDVQLVTVVGFPFGYHTLQTKVEEVQQAILDGAQELDVVHNISALKCKNYNALETEIGTLTSIIHDEGLKIKVIVESGILSEEELKICCEIYSGLGIDYMKTSTGFAEIGATEFAVSFMKKNLPETTKIKASGGIRTLDFAEKLILAGASRLGTSSGVALMKALTDKNA